MSRPRSLLVSILVLTLFWIPPEVGVAKHSSDRISDQELPRLIQRLSEEPGFFNSDNLITNESSYLQVLGRLRDLRVRDGVYLGVGPEQNFTYIAKTRPSLAIILDLRRPNLLFHGLFKSMFKSCWRFLKESPQTRTFFKEI